MTIRNTTTGWGIVARLFHWIMALMIIAMLIFGSTMESISDLAERFSAVQMHKSMGFTVFTLAILRVIWRLINPTPALPATMPRWQIMASHASHIAIYALIVAIPLSGWLMVTSSPLNDPGAYPVQVKNMVWGLFEMPDLFATGDKDLSETFHLVHEILTKSLMAILLLHVAAAVKHAVIDRDAVFARMIRKV